MPMIPPCSAHWATSQVKCRINENNILASREQASLNASKTKMMNFHSKQKTLKNIDSPNIKVNAIPIEYVTHFKFLGVILDCNMTWSSNINYIANKLSRICGIISRLKHHVPVYIMKIIYNSLFLSHLNYRITGFQCRTSNK